MSFNAYEEGQNERAFKELVEQHKKDTPRVGQPGAGRRGGIIEQSELERRVKERLSRELEATLKPFEDADGNLSIMIQGDN